MITGIHQMFGLFNASPDKAAHPVAIMPIGSDRVGTKKVDGYLALALSGKHPVKDAEQLTIIRLIRFAVFLKLLAQNNVPKVQAPGQVDGKRKIMVDKALGQADCHADIRQPSH